MQPKERSGPSSKRWAGVFNGKPKAMAVPEPKHRIGPQGSSTGQSVRKFPKSCVQQVCVQRGSWFLQNLDRIG